jgi:hypothetical protein
MKKLLVLYSFLSVFLLAGAQESYVMFETMYIKPKADKHEEFKKALAAHNKKYHAEGASEVFIRFVVNGKHEGEYTWVMGPTTWTDLDNRPADDAHDEDWSEVMQYIKDISEVEYWRQYEELSYFPEGWDGDSKIHVRIWDVKPGKWDEIKAIMAQVVNVYKEKKYPNAWSVYSNQFQTGNGRDIAGVMGFEKWAEYDEESTWAKDFDEVNGKNAWKMAMDFMRENTTMVEEVRELVPELGGSAQ